MGFNHLSSAIKKKNDVAYLKMNSYLCNTLKKGVFDNEIPE